MRLRKILLIDDEEDIREVAAISLEAMGEFEVVTAHDAVSGVAAAERERPDAVLLDVTMPGMDGVKAFHLLQESLRPHGVPVIFMTAKVQPAERKRLSELGARGIIAKPFEPLTLADQVAALIGGR